jgi:hypothetical protein
LERRGALARGAWRVDPRGATLGGSNVATLRGGALATLRAGRVSAFRRDAALRRDHVAPVGGGALVAKERRALADAVRRGAPGALALRDA